MQINATIAEHLEMLLPELDDETRQAAVNHEGTQAAIEFLRARGFEMNATGHAARPKEPRYRPTQTTQPDKGTTSRIIQHLEETETAQLRTKWRQQEEFAKAQAKEAKKSDNKADEQKWRANANLV